VTGQEEEHRQEVRFLLTTLILHQDRPEAITEAVLQMPVADQQPQALTAEAQVKETMFTTHVRAALTAILPMVRLLGITLRLDRPEDQAAVHTAFRLEASLIIQHLHAETIRRRQDLNLLVRQLGLTVSQVIVHHPAEVTVLRQEAVAAVEERHVLLQEDQDNSSKSV
jgi:hypothetical protein